jgi:integrating conjugative element protein (TIGR03761 family)
MGKLVSETQDTIAIHTLQAARVFQGMRYDDKRMGYPGMAYTSIAMTGIWEASGSDNPFVEWTLIQSEERLAGIDRKMSHYVQQVNEKIEHAKQMGLNISMAVNRKPAIYPINFGSPYGYLLARLVLNFDQFVRSVKGLEMRTLLSQDEGERTIHQVRREVLSTFQDIVSNRKIVGNKMLREIRRSDWLDTGKRNHLAAICAVVGLVPNDVLGKDRKPKHGRAFFETSLSSEVKQRLIEANDALADKVRDGVSG